MLHGPTSEVSNSPRNTTQMAGASAGPDTSGLFLATLRQLESGWDQAFAASRLHRPQQADNAAPRLPDIVPIGRSAQALSASLPENSAIGASSPPGLTPNGEQTPDARKTPCAAGDVATRPAQQFGAPPSGGASTSSATVPHCMVLAPRGLINKALLAGYSGFNQIQRSTLHADGGEGRRASGGVVSPESVLAVSQLRAESAARTSTLSEAPAVILHPQSDPSGVPGNSPCAVQVSAKHVAATNPSATKFQLEPANSGEGPSVSVSGVPGGLAVSVWPALGDRAAPPAVLRKLIETEVTRYGMRATRITLNGWTLEDPT